MKDKSVYDYDGAYESFQTKTKNGGKDDHHPDQKNRKSSRYIGDLMKAAKVRERERDATYERKIAREQAEENAKDEYQGKENYTLDA